MLLQYMGIATAGQYTWCGRSVFTEHLFLFLCPVMMLNRVFQQLLYVNIMHVSESTASLQLMWACETPENGCNLLSYIMNGTSQSQPLSIYMIQYIPHAIIMRCTLSLSLSLSPSLPLSLSPSLPPSLPGKTYFDREEDGGATSAQEELVQ